MSKIWFIWPLKILSGLTLFAPVPCRASIWSDSLMCSYHFHVTSVLEAPYPLLALIICCYGRWNCSSSGRSRHWGRPGCSSSPTAGGFSLLCFVPAFLAICYRSFRQFVCFACLPVVYLGLSLSRCLSSSFLLFPLPLFFHGFTSFVATYLPFACFSFRPGMSLFFV